VVFSSDGTLIASGSWDRTIKIWKVAAGINVKSFDTNQITKVMSFTDNDMVLVTSMGRFSLKARDVGRSQHRKHEAKLNSSVAQGEVDGKLGFGVSHDESWITAGGPDGRKVLWLPPDFRPGVSATLTEPSGSVVIGCPSGRVVIMGFRESLFSDEV
jgi:WD40 repeat protein